YVDQQRLQELSKDESFLAHQKRVKEHFISQVLTPAKMSDTPSDQKKTIAYFSMEFGIHESLPIFAGGLGMLAGDHLKAASDLSLSMVGIGILYRKGYFQQFLNQDGLQQENYPEIDIYHLPVEKIQDRSGNQVKFSIQGPDGDIHVLVWKIMVGRIPLYLLDTNLAENTPEIRDITATLYAGEGKTRLAQEVLLGIGGMRALSLMGIHPTVCHMNEGHSAFSSLERLAQVIETLNVDLKTALEIVPRATVFTTHTPVAAGHDEFPVDQVQPYLIPFEQRLGTKVEKIISWGQPERSGPTGPLSMFVLGLRMAQFCNAVSELHGVTARRMWSHVWPGRPEDEIPISHVTNGVHVPTWISRENAQLFERYLGPDWSLHPWHPDIIKRINEIYNEELWRAHEMSRSSLISNCRRLMKQQYERRNAPKAMLQEVESVLDHDALTIGFARRFATYKRADLILKDPDRFEALIKSKSHPVQFIFAGKAHPRDQEGKALIQRLVQFARREGIRHRIVFLENYDPHIARHLLQGADVWLNTPRRPFEACGTSGMKAALNGVLNVSTLDGWWCEGYSEELGWQIGRGEEFSDYEYQDAVESQALYNILENDVIPCFYDRKNGDIPQRWIEMMKASMRMTMMRFCSHRMVGEYEKRFYLPMAERYKNLLADEAAEAKALAVQYQQLRRLWKSIRIEPPVRDSAGSFRVGDTFRVTSVVHLDEVRPEEVTVQLYYGPLKDVDALAKGQKEVMTVQENRENGQYLYACTITCREAGRYGFTVRVVPCGDERLRFAPGFITWA
ncbi:MAG: alpha-glucan family phosphorylase, partial [Proteobacteria bacterium]|nr:alpha-glucan family phosphorylase [Pseudomonadota bacterium]